MTDPETVSEYIDQAPDGTQAKLRELRACLREVAPDAEEGLKWGNPAFSLDRILFTTANSNTTSGSIPRPQPSRHSRTNSTRTERARVRSSFRSTSRFR
ncbi:DUF1801 domain-containing protein [Halorarum halobium]|uniref:DUF1801 domain-containing protein n=1 Tax=Halorarum halobium TaxID=3075121 RepID=UPI003CCCBAF6